MFFTLFFTFFLFDSTPALHSSYFTSGKPQFSPIRPNLPPIPDYIESYTKNKTFDQTLEQVTNVEPAKGHGRNPIYIPVNSKDTDIATTQQLFENLTPKNFLPPEVVDHPEHLNEIGPPNAQTKAKAPLIGDSGCMNSLYSLPIICFSFNSNLQKCFNNVNICRYSNFSG